MSTETDIHTCSYYCHRPECIKAQRDELRDKLAALESQQQEPKSPTWSRKWITQVEKWIWLAESASKCQVSREQRKDFAQMKKDLSHYLQNGIAAGKASHPQVPDEREWDQASGRDGKIYADGWNACRQAMIAASQEQEKAE